MAEGRTIISFKVNDESFAFDALKVRHILELGKQTKVPNTPPFLLGVINLHGNIVPIADLRLLLGIENSENTKNTSVIVISPNDQLDSYLGLVVDLVKEVVQISNDSIYPSIIDGHLGMIDSFDGAIKLNDDFVNIINLDDLIVKIEEAK
jgi:purine-binding chemotaxis protein CheW